MERQDKEACATCDLGFCSASVCGVVVLLYVYVHCVGVCGWFPVQVAVCVC